MAPMHGNNLLLKNRKEGSAFNMFGIKKNSRSPTRSNEIIFQNRNFDTSSISNNKGRRNPIKDAKQSIETAQTHIKPQLPVDTHTAMKPVKIETFNDSLDHEFQNELNNFFNFKKGTVLK